MNRISRREFLRRSILGGVGLSAGLDVLSASTAISDSGKSRVAIATGNNRAEIIHEALGHFRKEIANAIGHKRILLKPNCVSHAPASWVSDLFLCNTHVDQMEAIIDFLYSIGKRDIMIAESPATGPAFDAFDNMGYFPLKNTYRSLRFADINLEGYRHVQVNGGGGNMTNVRISKLLLDRDTFVISAARIKTHNNAVATLSLKNVVMASPVQDHSLPGSRQDKSTMHSRLNGENHQTLHDNLYRVAREGVRPDLAIIDGFSGMQGDGPGGGYALDHRVAICSLDWLAADRVGLELMQISNGIAARGYSAQLPAYLSYCAQAGMGAWSLDDIELVGEPITGNTRNYALHSDLALQINLQALPPDMRTVAWSNHVGRDPTCSVVPGGYVSNEELAFRSRNHVA